MQTAGGRRITVATDWTDIKTEQADGRQSPTHLLDYGGLCQTVELIKHICKEKREHLVCQSEEGKYDENHQPKLDCLRRSNDNRIKPKQKEGGIKSGMGSIESGTPDEGNSPDGKISTQTHYGTNREEPEGGRK